MDKRRIVAGLMTVLIGLIVAFPVMAQRGFEARSRKPPANEQRVALVIGNSAYKNIPRLRNPVNDARAMGRVLEKSGFQVTTLLDADRRKMLRAIERFGKKLRKGGVGLFYYAGHGVQARGRNYLVPLAARVEDSPDLEYEAVDAGRVLAKMESAQNRLNIVILDACRNNPYGSGFRSARRGLAQVNAPSGSLVAYATGPGKVAADGDGRNGLYTERLIRHIRTPGLKLEDVFKRVRGDVRRLSGGKQVPWENTSVEGDFYFTRAGSAKAGRVATIPARTMDAEEELWKAIKSSSVAEDFDTYLASYPNGRFAVTARVKIRQLKRAKTTKTGATVERETPPSKMGKKVDFSRSSLKTDPNLVALFSFDNNFLAKSGIPFLIQNEGAELTFDRFGKPNSAAAIEKRFFSFDYILLDNKIFNGLKDFTVAFWAKLDTINRADNTGENNSFNSFLSIANSETDNQILFHYKHDKNILILSNWDGDYQWNIWGRLTVKEGVWNHYAITRDGDVGKIFFNGNLLAGGQISGKSIRSESAIIGQDQDNVGDSFQNWQVLNGAIDEFQIFSRALGSMEIKTFVESEGK